MKNTRSQNSRDEGLRKTLNEYEVTPPSYVWDNINDRLQESRPNKRNRFFYYLLPLAACIAAAVVYFAVIQPEGNSGSLTNANEQVKTKSPDIKALESGKSIEVERNLALSKENTEDIAANNVDAYTKEMASPNSELGRGSVNVASIETKKNEEVDQNIAGNSKGFINPNTSSEVNTEPLAIEPMSLIAFQVNPIVIEDAFKVASPLEKPNKPFGKKPNYNSGWSLSAHYAMLPNMSSPFNTEKSNDVTDRSQSPSSYNTPISSSKSIQQKDFMHAGVIVGKRMSKSFSIGAGVSLTKLNYRTEYAPVITKTSTAATYTTTTTNKTVKEQYTFGEIPLMLRYKTNGKGIAFFAEAGPSLRVNINSRITEDIIRNSDINRIIRDTQVVYVGNSFVSYTEETTYVEEVSIENRQESITNQNVSYAVPTFGLNFNIKGGVYVPLLKNLALEAGPIVQYNSPLTELRRVTMNFGLAGAITYSF